MRKHMMKIAVFLLVLFMTSNLLALDFNKRKSLNAVAVDFSLNDLSGKKVSLSSYQGKKVILFFWTTWCPFCLKEMAHLNKEYSNLENDGISLLAINIDESKAKIDSFARKNAIKFPILLDEGAMVAEDYEVFGIPTIILINSEGKIVSLGNNLPEDYVELLG